MKRIILASESPRRFDLLKSLGLDVLVIPSHIEEINHNNVSPEKYARELAHKKLESVKSTLNKDLSSLPMIAADTIVVLGKEIIEKPRDERHAEEMLRTLSGKTHHVFTSYVCTYNKEYRERFVMSEVTFKKLHDSEIEWYLTHDEPYDKAGSYAIQGYGAFMIEAINGSYTNVVGLPLSHVVSDLTSLGFLVFPHEK